MKYVIISLLIILSFVCGQIKFLSNDELSYSLPNFSNENNITNSSILTYTFYNKVENNYYFTYIKGSNSTSPNTSSFTSNMTFIHNRNFHRVNQRFYYGSNRSYENLVQNISSNVTRVNYSDGTHIYLDTFYYTQDDHYLTGNDYFSNTYNHNFTIVNYTIGNTVYISENYFGYYTWHFNSNGTNRTNVTTNNTQPKIRNQNGNYSNYITNYSNLTKNTYPIHKNSSNETNQTIIYENFENTINNYYRKFYNYTFNIPCNYDYEPYCIGERATNSNKTYENYWYNSTTLVRNITHFITTDYYFSVYYNPYYRLPFEDLIFNNSTFNKFETIYDNN